MTTITLTDPIRSNEFGKKCIIDPGRCIYFGLDGQKFIQEFFWKVALTQETFDQWFVVKTESPFSFLSTEEKQTNWCVRHEISEPLRSQLVLNFCSASGMIDRKKLLQLGARFLRPSCVEIVVSGNLRLLKWAYTEEKVWRTSQPVQKVKTERRLPFEKTDPYVWNEDSTATAASIGNLEILKYLHQKECPWDEWTCDRAAEEGHLECLKYAHENGCPWDKGTCAVATHGNVECLKYAHENGCPWDERTCESAVGSGHLECLKYAHENGCPWDERSCSRAAQEGQLECLKYLHENGCPWDEGTCMSAAQEGQLECLKYLHENGCPWNDETCAGAATWGHLECLKYLHENGCPWNEETYDNSGDTEGHLACLEYLRQNGCPTKTED